MDHFGCIFNHNLTILAHLTHIWTIWTHSLTKLGPFWLVEGWVGVAVHHKVVTEGIVGHHKGVVVVVTHHEWVVVVVTHVTKAIIVIITHHTIIIVITTINPIPNNMSLSRQWIKRFNAM